MATDPDIIAMDAIAKMVTKKTCADKTTGIVKAVESATRAVERVTGKIDAIQADTSHIKIDLASHQAEHSGRDKAQANGINKQNKNARLVGLIFVVVMGIGGLIWTAAKLMNQPDVSDIVKQVIAAQKNP